MKVLTAPLPRTMSVAETWAFGFNGLLLWLFIVADAYLELGSKAMLVWIPLTIFGVVINLQVKRLSLLWPDVAGGTSNYAFRLLRDSPLLRRYVVFAYFQGWCSTVTLSAILLADVIVVYASRFEFAVPSLPLMLFFVVIAYAVALSSSRSLSMLVFAFMVPAVTFLVGYVLWGAGWVALSPASPAMVAATTGSATFPGWAKYYLLGAYAVYAVETSAGFMADSRRPAATARCLSTVIWLMPIVFIAGSWVFDRTVAGMNGGVSPTALLVLTSATTFAGESAEFLVGFMLASGCLLGCAACAGQTPRILFQLARDGDAAPLYGVCSPHGGIVPAVFMSMATAVSFLLWQDFALLLAVSGIGWFLAFTLLHWGLWVARGTTASPQPVLALAMFGVELLVLGGAAIAFGPLVTAFGLLWPLVVQAVTALVARAPLACLQPSWWEARYQRPASFLLGDAAIRVVLVIPLVCGVGALAWFLGGQTGGLVAPTARGLFAVFLVVVGFVGLAYTTWASVRASLIELLKTEVADRQRAEREASHTAQQLTLILEAAADGLYGVDVDGRISFVNPAAAQLLGYTTAELVGQSAHDRFHGAGSGAPGDASGCRLCAAARDGTALAPADIYFSRRDSRSIAIDCASSPLYGSDRRIVGAVVAFRDITMRQKAEAELRATLAMQTDFVSFVSHQLRTPISGVKWLLELALQETGMAAKARSFVEDAQRSAMRLASLVNDMLNLARMERGTFTMDLAPVDLPELTQDVLAELQPLCLSRRHRLQVDPQASPLLISADRQLLRQVIVNLLSNAMKYTPDGGDIRISMSSRGGLVRWSIQDSGIGIPAAARSRLFEKFFRADNVLLIETEGTGLGLCVAKLIVEKLDGRIWCESEEGHGATFTFEVPAVVQSGGDG